MGAKIADGRLLRQMEAMGRTFFCRLRYGLLGLGEPDFSKR